MKLFTAATTALVVLAGSAFAEGGITVQLPDISSLSETEASALISQLAQVNVITSNCPGFEISDGEWALITGTGDRLAASLGVDTAAYDREYYGPAFKLLDDPEACDRIGPTAKPLIGRLTAMGGGTVALTQSQ